MSDMDVFDDNPYDMFNKWFKNAQDLGLPKPEAFYLSSIGLDGKPKARTVLHKGLVGTGLNFYTNYESDKAKEFEKNPEVSALFYWNRPMDHQLRLSGRVEKLSIADSDAYFSTRPRGSQIGAWASPQSKILGSVKDLETLVDDAHERFINHEEVPRPEFWGGYKIIISSFEFMILRQDRLHDRIRYIPKGDQWEKQVIAP